MPIPGWTPPWPHDYGLLRAFEQQTIPPKQEFRAEEIESLQRRIRALEAQVASLLQWQLDDLTNRRWPR